MSNYHSQQTATQDVFPKCFSCLILHLMKHWGLRVGPLDNSTYKTNDSIMLYFALFFLLLRAEWLYYQSEWMFLASCTHKRWTTSFDFPYVSKIRRIFWILQMTAPKIILNPSTLLWFFMIVIIQMESW